MKKTSRNPLRYAALALALCGSIGLASAQVFGPPDTDFKGTVRATAQLVLPGTETGIEGTGFKPGQKVTLLRGDTVLNAQPYVADAEGKFTATLAIPADAANGFQPIVVRTSGPDAASIFELKVSKELPLSGQADFDVTSSKLVQGLYQVAYSAKANAVYVTSAVGRPPVSQSQLLKVDPKTLKVLASVTPAEAPAPQRPAGAPPQGGPGGPGGAAPQGPGVYAVYGVATDDANGNVWVTNTRQNTVAVYRQSDLSLVKQFPVGAAPHSRDVAIDALHGKAYVTNVGVDYLSVFDTKTLEKLEDLKIASGKRGESFSATSLDLDPETNKLYTASLSTSEAAVIDLATGKTEKVFPLGNARSAIGVAWNPLAKRLLVVSQGSDNLLIVDPATAKVEHDVYVGAGALNVSYDPSTRLAYVSNRVAGTVAVVDEQGKVVANLDGGTFPNHLSKGPKGVVFAVNKSRGTDDPKGDRISRITYKKKGR